MNDATTWDVFLLALRAVCHFFIFLRVVTYVAAPGARHKKTVGAVAAAFAGCNLAECIRILFNFGDFAASTEFYLPWIMFCVFLFVMWSGGNVAKFLPHTVTDRLP